MVRRTQERLTAKRKAEFLAELARHGVFARAARIASPRSLTGACATFREEAKRDPEFAAQIAEAKEQADGELLVELHRRAVEGVDEPIFDRDGNQVGARRRVSDRLLIEKLRSRFPREFAARSVSEVTQETRVDARVQPIGLRKLSRESRRQLREVLERELANRSEGLPRPEGDQ